MANSSPQTTTSDENILVGLILAALAVLAVVVLYHKLRSPINGLLLYFAKLEVAPFVPFSDTARSLLESMGRISDPGKLTYHDVSAWLDAAGSYGRWWLPAPFLYGIYALWRRRGWIHDFTRPFDMASLARHNVAIVPALAPAVLRKKPIIEEPTGRGPWRVAESPMLFAVRHGIVTNAKGERIEEGAFFLESGLPKPLPDIPAGGIVYSPAKAREVFISRMGPRFPGADENGLMGSQPRYIIGLTGAFCAYALGKRKAGKAILESMSLSWSEDRAMAVRDETTEVCGDFDLDIKDAQAWIGRMFRPIDPNDPRHEAALALLAQKRLKAHDAWLHPWMGRLLMQARQNGGTLPPAEFLWLRVANRPLWYFFSSLGGSACMVEGAAPWSHLITELRWLKIHQARGQTCDHGLEDPEVKPAVLALRKAIEDEGWMRYSVTPSQAEEEES